MIDDAVLHAKGGALELQATGDSLKSTDRALILLLELCKQAGNQEDAKLLGEVRKGIWWIQSLQFFGQDEAPSADKSLLNRLYQNVCALQWTQIFLWAPLSLMDLYGSRGLATIVKSIGGVSVAKPTLHVLQKAHCLTGTGFTEFDLFIKILGALVEGKKGVKRTEFVVKTCLLTRSACSYFGYSELSSLFGIIGAGVGVWKAFKTPE